ncbi:Gfo/Idh/MocA family oxidoreductase [Helicobacter sp. faydin-H20]|uniref:Gfo/Idh/MocA family protein n=1 Tax=Helicobacter anatolicus TaxID=2905874 RepID=UPI001E45BBD9|nr:Gfo/Idh/MocA family oxidoreductase [Helicobacter anatolicus]MCE3037023.1 Gfo/Idh/MocA family oxidoreductase [Helicobacter anatolicus]
MKNFALIGVAGYVAPKHLKAIYETKNNLLCALDPKDSVGILDSYFPQTHFFTEFERFDRHISKLQNKGIELDYITICSPNYLHDSHIRFALKNNANAICEKPLVLNPWNIDTLIDLEKKTGKKVYNILQLRLHPNIIALKEKIQNTIKKNPQKRFQVKLTYITSRGNWYFTSWKGDLAKSGGIATNIGVHFFDMLQNIFGEARGLKVHINTKDTASGTLDLPFADVTWFLSIDAKNLPSNAQRTYRSIELEGEEIEFSNGFENLHTKSYEEILKNQGFGLLDAYPCISLVHKIRNLEITPLIGEYHPLCKNI